MSDSPPNPVSKVTNSTRIWPLLIVPLILLASSTGLALEPATENQVTKAQVESVDPQEASTPLQAAKDRERDAAMLRTTANKLEAQTRRTADMIVEGQALRLIEQLTLQNDETAQVSEKIAHRIDARLSKAVSKLRNQTSTRVQPQPL
jgi:hypothetical protein